MEQKRIVVTGGAGFIGSNIAKALIALGHEVVILDNLSTGKKERVPEEANFFLIDLSIEPIENITRILEGADVVFHTAAFPRVQPSILDPITSNMANVDSTLRLLEAAKQAKVRRVVYSASSSCYGDATEMPLHEELPKAPMSPYGLQKYIGEEYCRVFALLYDIETVSLRYFNVYGEGMSDEGAYCTVLSIFKNQRMGDYPLTITNDGNQRRDFTYVGDVVNANIRAAFSDKVGKGEAINIGNGSNYSVNEVADMIGGAKEYGEQRVEPFETLADISKAQELLDWEPKGDLPKWIEQWKKTWNKLPA